MTTSTVNELRTRLDAHDQGHLLAFHDQLDAAAAEALLRQINALDLEQVDSLIEQFVRNEPEQVLPTDLAPAPYYAYGGRKAGSRGRDFDATACRDAGETLLRGGGVAAFTVAGGQGTRLGWNGPKGTFPATVVTGKPLFRCFAEQILAAEQRYGVVIPWYIMTSPLNDAATRAYFLDNNCFGLRRNDIFMFPQGVMPSFDVATGRLLLAEKHAIAVNPDGHGGSLRALEASGALEDMRARGIEHISYFQVDNPLVKVIDPLFIGLHVSADDSSAEMSSKMVAKAEPGEKVGVFATSSGRTMVVEYSDLPAELAEARTDDGGLAYEAGSIAIHLIAVQLVEQLTESGRLALPFHRALKKVPFIDPATGERVDPSEPNAVKLEQFVFDALPLARGSIVVETDRTEEFAPIKNRDGADSPATSHQLQSDRHGRWLESVGVAVARRDDGHVAAAIEISPLTALEAADLRSHDLPASIGAGEDVVL